jgi:hypothetical protein
LAAAGCIKALSRIINAITNKGYLLTQIRRKIIPVIKHGLCVDYTYSFDDSVSCFGMLAHYESSQEGLTTDMWRLYRDVMIIVGGGKNDTGGGPAFEYLRSACVAFQIFIARDPEGLKNMCPDTQKISFLDRTLNFIKRSLNVFAKTGGY